MNTGKNRKILIIVSVIITILILAFLIYMIFNQFFKPKVSIIGRDQFRNHLIEATKDTTDNITMSDWRVDYYAGTINYKYNGFDSNRGREFSTLYSAYVGRPIASDFLSAGNKIESENYFNMIGAKTFHDLIAKAQSGSQNSTILNVPIDNGKPSFLRSLALSLLPTLLTIGLLYFLYRAMMKRSMNMMGAVGDSKNPAKKIKSDKTFKDVAGNSEAIEEIQEIVDYLKNPKKYQTAGARMPHGILLGGPPGTGKTLLAKATAGEADVPFYFISASNFVEMYVGLGAKRVRTVVDEARKNTPAIIFIDELDAIGRTRGAGLGGGHDEREQTLNQLLVEMDGMKENNGLLFFAATNRTDVLDPALTRPGRFDRTITVGLPDVKERQEILELHAKGKRMSPEIDLAKVAKRTPGYSGAQLENVINEASLLAVRSNSDVINRVDIDEAIDRVMAGPAKKNRVISKNELTMVAYHEAGHAVVGIKVAGGNKVQKITIIPRGQAGGYNLMTPEEEKYNMSRKELIAMITGYMGGRASEQLIYGKDNVSTGASDDISKATKIARKMVTEWGMSALGPIQYEKDEGSPFLGRDYLKSAGFSNQVGHEIDIEVRKIILEAEQNATRVIKANMELLELIKTALLDKETIVAEEIEYIAKNMKLPPKKKIEKTKINKINLDDLLSEDDSDSDTNVKPSLKPQESAEEAIVLEGKNSKINELVDETNKK